MPERITVRLDDALYGQLREASRQGAMDVSTFVRQALITALDRTSDTSASVPLHHPDDCLHVVVSHASPRAQHHLTEVFARLDGSLACQGRSRLWFVAETLALWAAKAEPRAHAADA
jgi:hypothetical protein